jgi:hypothetical protein
MVYLSLNGEISGEAMGRCRMASDLADKSVNLVAIAQAKLFWSLIVVDSLSAEEKPQCARIRVRPLAKRLKEFAHSG